MKKSLLLLSLLLCSCGMGNKNEVVRNVYSLKVGETLVVYNSENIKKQEYSITDDCSSFGSGYSKVVISANSNYFRLSATKCNGDIEYAQFYSGGFAIIEVK